MKQLMKQSVISSQFLLLSLTLIALPHLSSAAQGPRQWTVKLNPTSITVTPGLASNATSTVTITEGSQLAASTNGVTLTVTVSPLGAGVTASLVSTGAFTGVSN